MPFNIDAALDATPARGTRKCKLQQILDDIPDSPRKDEMLGRVADADGWSAPTLALSFSAGGCPVSNDLINNHRNKRCLCFR